MFLIRKKGTVHNFFRVTRFNLKLRLGILRYQISSILIEICTKFIIFNTRRNKKSLLKYVFINNCILNIEKINLNDISKNEKSKCASILNILSFISRNKTARKLFPTYFYYNMYKLTREIKHKQTQAKNIE